MITDEEKEHANELKHRLADTIKAYQEENEPLPDDILKAMAVVYALDQAIQEDDRTKYLFLLNELISGNGNTTLNA